MSWFVYFNLYYVTYDLNIARILDIDICKENDIGIIISIIYTITWNNRQGCKQFEFRNFY